MFAGFNATSKAHQFGENVRCPIAAGGLRLAGHTDIGTLGRVQLPNPAPIVTKQRAIC
jgi:hypothetical protein